MFFHCHAINVKKNPVHYDRIKLTSIPNKNIANSQRSGIQFIKVRGLS